MAAVGEVIKGFFVYADTNAGNIANTITVTAKGVTKVRFPKQGTNGDFWTADLTGSVFTIAPQSWGASSLCGINEVNWANDMPWFDYLVNNDNTLANVMLCTSRNPSASVLPPTTNIGKNGTAPGTSSQIDFITCGGTAATQAVPIVGIGSHRQQYVTATHLWNCTSALAATDGFGRFQEGVQFTMPVGQNGASKATEYLYSSTAKVPTFATHTYTYLITKSGMVRAKAYMINGTVDGGAGAAQVFIVLPYVSADTTWGESFSYANSNGTAFGVMGLLTAASANCALMYLGSAAALANPVALAETSVATGAGSTLSMTATYQAF